MLPILFSYSQIALDKDSQWVPLDARLVDSMQGHLTSLSDHELQIYTKMRSKFKSSSIFAFDESFDDLLINLCRIQDGDNFLKSVPNALWMPHLPKGFGDFERFVSRYTLRHHIKSVVVHTEEDYKLHHASTANVPLAHSVSQIWSQVFSCLDPSRVVVAAPPTTLAGLLDTQMLTSDTWAFDMKIHYVELSYPPLLSIEHISTTCRPWNTALIHRKPWYHLGYNEGSSITAYSTYEYHLKQSPKMLYLTLVRLAKEASNCCNIRSFKYIGIFPFATNTTTMVRALHRIQTVREISVQLAPGPENKLLSDSGKMGRAQPSDLWLEWTESYKVIVSYLGVFDFKNGAVFRSLDGNSEQQASEVEECMNLLRKRGAGWTKQDRGIWMRDGSN